MFPGAERSPEATLQGPQAGGRQGLCDVNGHPQTQGFALRLHLMPSPRRLLELKPLNLHPSQQEMKGQIGPLLLPGSYPHTLFCIVLVPMGLKPRAFCVQGTCIPLVPWLQDRWTHSLCCFENCPSTAQARDRAPGSMMVPTPSSQRPGALSEPQSLIYDMEAWLVVSEPFLSPV